METIDAVIAESARLLGFDKQSCAILQRSRWQLMAVGSRSIICSTNFGPAKETSTLLASAHESARSLLRSLQSAHVREHNK